MGEGDLEKGAWQKDAFEKPVYGRCCPQMRMAKPRHEQQPKKKKAAKAVRSSTGKDYCCANRMVRVLPPRISHKGRRRV